MAHAVIVRHTVNDFDAWKVVFDEHEANRRKHGCTSHAAYRNGNEVVVVSYWPGAEEAQGFLSDPSLKEAMSRAGVTSEPTVYVVEEVEALSY